MSTTQEAKIDWSQPVQTKETPSRKVEIVTTKGRGEYPVLGYIGDLKILSSWTTSGNVRLDALPSDVDLENAPTWKLPDPPPNQQWHRNDWTEEMLPAGYRPLLLGEAWIKGDEIKRYSHPDWDVAGKYPNDALGQETTVKTAHCRTTRTTRTIPQQPEQWAAEKAAFAAGETIQYRSYINPTWVDTKEPLWFSREGHPFNPEYRIKPKQQKVPLEPCDVPPGSVIRDENNNAGRWYFVLSVGPSGLVTCEDTLKPFQYLKDLEWQIKRPTDTEFQPCWKHIDPK
jgi:hypothetical protein